MGLSINTNIPALGANRQTKQTTNSIFKNFEGLSSGLRINRARDDAAGLAIAERFRTQIRQYSVEINNYQSGINAAQTAEGALSTQNDAMQRVRELAVQAANGTLSDADRQALNDEAQQLLGEIDATATNTEFNGTNLLEADQTIQLDAEGNANLNLEESTVDSLNLNGLDISTQAGAESALTQIDQALGQLNDNRASLGAQQNRFEYAIANRENTNVNLAASESAIRDLDIARATTNQMRDQILLQAGLGALAQSNIVGERALMLLQG